MGKANADGKPKKRMSAYDYFVQACREEHKNVHPGKKIVLTTFSRQCAKLWKSLTKEQKHQFQLKKIREDLTLFELPAMPLHKKLEHLKKAKANQTPTTIPTPPPSPPTSPPKPSLPPSRPKSIRLKLKSAPENTQVANKADEKVVKIKQEIVETKPITKPIPRWRPGSNIPNNSCLMLINNAIHVVRVEPVKIVPGVVNVE